MKLSGHKTADVFRRYNICDVDDTREAMKTALADNRAEAELARKVIPLRKQA
jgi:hypothetical protein